MPAAPTGAELATTCRTALAAGYRGVEAAMCDWYVRPCRVCGAPEEHPAWCIPDRVSASDLAEAVITEIEARSDAQTRPAKALVGEILARRFPCPASGSGPGTVLGQP